MHAINTSVFFVVNSCTPECWLRVKRQRVNPEYFPPYKISSKFVPSFERKEVNSIKNFGISTIIKLLKSRLCLYIQDIFIKVMSIDSAKGSEPKCMICFFTSVCLCLCT